ncbi:isochorismatase family protein [Pseudomonas silvicola]|nr:isochorismatase family protein [Pseudomonas silvicola]
MVSAQDNYQGVWGNRIGFGQRPALLMIDFMQGYTTEGAPLFAPGVVSAVAESVSLLAAARQAGIPVIHTNIRYHPGHFADGGMWVKKAPVMKDMVEGNPLAAFCPSWTLEQRALRAEWLHTCFEPAIVQAYQEFHSVDIHQDFPALRQPALLMVAGRGGVILPEDEAAIHALHPAIEISHAPEAGHMIPWDDFDGFFAALGNFLGHSFC